MTRTSTRRRLALGLGTSTLLVGLVAGPVAAADSVSAGITAGVRTAVFANLVLPSSTYQNTEHAVSGSLVLTVDDSTDTKVGWGVTSKVSDFVYSGPNAGSNIPAAAFVVTSADAPVWVAGQPISVAAATGPQVATTFAVGGLHTERKTIEATTGYGAGTYTQALGVTLTIPAMSRVGTYTGTLTTTFVAAP